MIKEASDKGAESPTINSMMKILNSEIESIYSRSYGSNIITELTKFYWNCWTGLKHVYGTSAGCEYLGEYCIFQTLRHHLENTLRLHYSVSKEETLQSTKWVWTFVDNPETSKIILAHNLKIALDDNKLKRNSFRPDICIIRPSDGKIVCVMEVKVLFSSSSVFNKTIEDLALVTDQRAVKGYLVVLDDVGPNSEKCNLGLIKGTDIRFIGPKGNRLEDNFTLVSFEDCLEEITECVRRNCLVQI